MKYILSLGGGGARATYEVGVLEVLSAYFNFSYIYGISAGAIVAAMYSNNEDMSKIATDLIKINVFNVNKSLDYYLSSITSVPDNVRIQCTNLANGKKYTFKSEDLTLNEYKDAIKASAAAIPFLLKGKYIKGNFYVDGGVQDTVVSDIFEEGKTIAVHTYGPLKNYLPKSSIGKSIKMLRLTKYKPLDDINKYDYVIGPSKRLSSRFIPKYKDYLLGKEDAMNFIRNVLY